MQVRIRGSVRVKAGWCPIKYRSLILSVKCDYLISRFGTTSAGKKSRVSDCVAGNFSTHLDLVIGIFCVLFVGALLWKCDIMVYIIRIDIIVSSSASTQFWENSALNLYSLLYAQTHLISCSKSRPWVQ